MVNQTALFTSFTPFDVFRTFIGFLNEQLNPEDEGDEQEFTEGFESPVRVYIGPDIKPEDIEVAAVYDEDDNYFIVTAEEIPNDVLGRKMREVIAFPNDCVITDAVFDTDTTELLVNLAPIGDLNPASGYGFDVEVTARSSSPD